MIAHMDYMKNLLTNSRLICICCRPKCNSVVDRVASTNSKAVSISNTVLTVTAVTMPTAAATTITATITTTATTTATTTSTATTTTTTTTTTTATAATATTSTGDTLPVMNLPLFGFVLTAEPDECEDYVLV